MAKKAKAKKSAPKKSARPAKAAVPRRAAATLEAAPPPPPMHRTCGTMEVHHRLMELHPEYRSALGRLEMAMNTPGFTEAAAMTSPVTIPVVVHVVFRTNQEN